MNRKLTCKQRAAIKAARKVLERIDDCGLVIAMQCGTPEVHFKSDYERFEFDHGAHGMKDENGQTIDSLCSLPESITH